MHQYFQWYLHNGVWSGLCFACALAMGIFAWLRWRVALPLLSDDGVNLFTPQVLPSTIGAVLSVFVGSAAALLAVLLTGVGLLVILLQHYR